MWVLFKSYGRPVLKVVKAFGLEPGKVTRNGQEIEIFTIIDVDASQRLEALEPVLSEDAFDVAETFGLSELGCYTRPRALEIFDKIIAAAEKNQTLFRMPESEV